MSDLTFAHPLVLLSLLVVPLVFAAWVVGARRVRGPPNPGGVMPASGSKFLMIEFPPTPPGELSGPGIHSTDTIDYLTVVKGEIVMITETGSVVGDITAQRISVLGYTEGVLDAGQGEVSLQATARVHGRVRYGRIQVNGADLNATLERVMPSNKGA